MAASLGSMLDLGFVSLICLIGGCLSQNSVDKCEGNVPNCYCTDYVIDCKGQEFINIDEIFPYITGRTFRVSITDGKLDQIPSDLFGPVVDMTDADHLYNLTFLNLSGNGIKQLGEGAFNHLPRLQTLDLSGNDITISPCGDQNSVSTSLSKLVDLKALNLGRAFSKKTVDVCDLGNIVGDLNMTRLTQLDLSGNGFSMKGRKFDTFMELSYSLELLNLSHNNFAHFIYGLGYVNLVEYDFSFNQMEFLSAQETDEIENMPRLRTMSIGGNPIHCDCRMSMAYTWFNSTERPLDFDNIICKYSDNVSNIGRPIMKLRLADFCEGPRIAVCPGGGHQVAGARSTSWIIVIAATFLVVIAVVSVILAVRHRRRRHHTGMSTSPERVNKSPAYSRMV